MKKIFPAILLSLCIVSCNKPGKNHANQKFDQKAVECNNKACELMTIGKYDSALVFFDRAISIDTSYYLPYVGKASLYMDQKNYAKALASVENALRLNPDYMEGYAGAGLICDRMKNNKKALDYYRKGLERYEKAISQTNKKDKEQMIQLKLNKAFLLIQLGQTNEAKALLKGLKEAEPDNMKIDELLKMDRNSFLKNL